MPEGERFKATVLYLPVIERSPVRVEVATHPDPALLEPGVDQELDEDVEGDVVPGQQPGVLPHRPPQMLVSGVHGQQDLLLVGRHQPCRNKKNIY